MNRLSYMLTFMLLITLFASCVNKQDDDVMPAPPEEVEERSDTLEYTWRVPVLESGFTELTVQPQIFGDNVMYSNRIIFEDETLHMISTDDKEAVWQWHDYLGVENSEVRSGTPSSYCRWEDYFIFSSGAGTINAVDLSNGSTVWQTKIEEGGTTGRLTLFEDKIYTSHNSGGVEKEILYIVETEAATGLQDTIYTLEETEDNYLQEFKSFAAAQNAQGETILYTLHLRLNLNAPGTDGELRLMSFNAETKQKIFETDSYSIEGSTIKPVILNGKVYFASFKDFYCVDGLTGETLWVRELSNNDTFAQSGWIAAEGKIFAKSDHSKMFAFDAESGETIWEIETGSTCSYLEYYKGVIYFGCNVFGEIHAVDAETGEDYWNYKPPSNDYQYASFLTTPGIDRENGIIYACDRYYLYSIPAVNK